MDGRSAVMNVLAGALLGVAVPVVGAIALEQAHPDFVWLDHFLTIILLCIFCAGIGVLINLPWQELHDHSGSDLHDEPHPIHDSSSATNDADDANAHDSFESEGQSSHRSHRASPTTSFAMSRREAFRTLELDLNADATEVRSAFRRLAREHHPDHAMVHGDEAVAQATQKFQRVRAAYQVLLADSENEAV